MILLYPLNAIEGEGEGGDRGIFGIWNNWNWNSSRVDQIQLSCEENFRKYSALYGKRWNSKNRKKVRIFRNSTVLVLLLKKLCKITTSLREKNSQFTFCKDFFCVATSISTQFKVAPRLRNPAHAKHRQHQTGYTGKYRAQRKITRILLSFPLTMVPL